MAKRAVSRFRQALAEKSFNGYTSANMNSESKSRGLKGSTHAKWQGPVAMRLAIVFACLLLVALLNPASLSPAFAAGAHHVHAMLHIIDEAPVVAHVSAARHEAAASGLLVKFAPNGLGCPEHDGRGPNEKSGQCCGMACCAMAMAGVDDIGLAIADQSTSHTPLPMQFVPVGLIFGLNRPPDFLS